MKAKTEEILGRKLPFFLATSLCTPPLPLSLRSLPASQQSQWVQNDKQTPGAKNGTGFATREQLLSQHSVLRDCRASGSRDRFRDVVVS